MDVLGDERRLLVAAYPVAWRIEVVDDDVHRGFEYVRYEPDIPQCTRAAHPRWIPVFSGESRRVLGK